MALPQLPAHVVHKLGQRVIEQGTRSREYMQKSRTTVRLFSCMQSLLCQERVLFWEIQTIFFLKVRSFLAWGRWRSALNGTSSIAPEESPLWGVSAIHRTKSILLAMLAWLSNFRLPKQLTEHPSAPFGRNICFGRCVLRSLCSLRTIRPFRVDGMA